MPVYQDEKTKTWFCKFYYQDWTGERKQKKKRGFPTKREAAVWERNFLQKQHADMNMPFSSLVELYYEDMSHRLKQSSMNTKRYMIDLKLIPFFGKLPVCEITPAHVRKWQNELMDHKNENGEPFSPTYLKTINNQLSAILNYAIKYYGLSSNPCHMAGSIGKSRADTMKFWTREEFETFLLSVSNRIQSRAAFLTLYYTGMRVGELLALTPMDIDMNNKTISITKSFQRIGGEDVITSPKTIKSRRIITIPAFLCEELNNYIEKLYKPTDNDRIFPFTKHYLLDEMIRGCKLSGVKRIRIHDLRHSHASLLIEMGFSPLLIAERLGHEDIETTLNTYSHLYPHKQNEIAEKLDLVNSTKSVP